MPGSALKEPTVDELASAARQLQYALDGSETTDEAFEKLYATVGSRQAESLRQLESLLKSEPDAPASKSVRRSAYPTLAWLIRQTTTPARSAAALFAEFRRQQSFSAAGIAAVWSDFSGYLTYLGAVLGVLIVVAGMFAVLVLPQFQSLYSGFGADLPVVTSAVFGPRSAIFTLSGAVALALIAFLSWFLIQLRRRLRRYAPMPAGYQKFPLVGPVASTYNQYLWLAYAALLRAAGMATDRALAVAGEATIGAEAGTSAASGDLSAAAKLGKLDAEIQFQEDASVDALLAALVRCRRRSRLILTVLVYGLVALFVSAMYLPIFSLGSAI